MKNLTLFLLLIAFIFCPVMSYAAENQGIIVSPLIIDEKASIRDILEYSIKLKNTTQSKVSIYPVINDISRIEGKQEFLDPTLLDKSTSLARWAEFSRGVFELLPGEEKEFPVLIKINLQAKPGKYYAIITFAQGGNRAKAEDLAKTLNQPQLMLNIEVEEHIIEKAEIRKFQTEKNINLSYPINFLLEINNIGNKDITPSGSISIYDRRGKEVGSIDVNPDKTKIFSQEKSNLVFNLDDVNGFGKYKAKLEIEYGDGQSRDLQDTIYFWILSWKMLAMFGGAVFLLLIILIIVIFKQTHRYKPDDNRMRKNSIK